jgi:hypothetical protein
MEEKTVPVQPESKGLSKGCLIGLIVLGVVLLLVVIGGVTCYLKRHEIVKFGVTTVVGSIKQELARNPVSGVDTVAVDGVADAFIKKLNESEPDGQKMAALAQSLQAIMSDMKVDSAEASRFVDAMVEYFPELQSPASGQAAPTGDSVTTGQ